eukprot:tig00001472_g8884.t1
MAGRLAPLAAVLLLAIALAGLERSYAQTPTASPTPSPTPSSNSTNATAPTPTPGIGPAPLQFLSVSPLVGDIGGGTTVTFVMANNTNQSSFEIAVVYFAGVAGSKRPKEPGRLQVVTNRDPGTGLIPLRGAINYTLIGDPVPGRQYTIPNITYKFNDSPRINSVTFTYASNPKETHVFRELSARAAFTAYLPVAGTVRVDVTTYTDTSLPYSRGGAFDRDGPTLVYNWQLVSGPAVDFGNGTRPFIVFTPGATPRRYTFGLTVFDSDNFTVYREIDVTVSLQQVVNLAMRLAVPDLNLTARLFADPAFLLRFKGGISDTYGIPPSRTWGVDTSVASVAPAPVPVVNGTAGGVNGTAGGVNGTAGAGNGTRATPTPAPRPAGGNATQPAGNSTLALAGGRRALRGAAAADGPIAGTVAVTAKLVAPEASALAALLQAIQSVPLRSLTAKIGAATDYALGTSMEVLAAVPSLFARPANALPLALLVGGPAVTVPSSRPTFVVDSSASYDPDGYIVRYLWSGTLEFPCGAASYYLCSDPPARNPSWQEGSYSPLAEASLVVPLNVSAANATAFPIAGYRPFFRYTVTLQVVDNDGMLCAQPFTQVIDIERTNAAVRAETAPVDLRPCLEFPVLEPVRFSGKAVDPDLAGVFRDGRVVAMEWRQVYGPAGVPQRALPLSATATDYELTAPAVGYYGLELTATDNTGSSHTVSASFCVASNSVSRWARALARGFEPFVATALPFLAVVHLAARVYVALSGAFLAPGISATNLLGLLSHVQHVSLTGDLAAAPADYRHLTHALSWTNAQFPAPWDRGVATPDAAYRRYYAPLSAALAAANASSPAAAAAALAADPDMVDPAYGWDPLTVFPGTVFYCTVCALGVLLLHASLQYAVRAASRFTLPFPYPIAVPGLELGLFLALFGGLALSAAKVVGAGPGPDSAQFALAVLLLVGLFVAGPVAAYGLPIYAVATGRIAFFFDVEPPWGHHLAMRALYRAGRVRAPTNPHAEVEVPGFERPQVDAIRKEAPVVETGATKAVDGDLDASPQAAAARDYGEFLASLRLPNQGRPRVLEEDRAAAYGFRPEETHKRRVLQIRAWYDPPLDWCRRLVRIARRAGEPLLVRGDWCAAREEERRWLFALAPLLMNYVWDGSRGFFFGALPALFGAFDLSLRLAEALLVGCLAGQPLAQAAALLACEAAALLYILLAYPYRNRLQFALHAALRAFNVAVLALLVDAAASPRPSPVYPFTLAFHVSILHATSVVVAVAAESSFLLVHLLNVFFGPTAEASAAAPTLARRAAGDEERYGGAFDRTGGTGIRLAGETLRAGTTQRAAGSTGGDGQALAGPPEETVRGGRPTASSAPSAPPPAPSSPRAPRAAAGTRRAMPEELRAGRRRRSGWRGPGVGSLARPLEREVLDDEEDEDEDAVHEFELPVRAPPAPPHDPSGPRPRHLEGAGRLRPPRLPRRRQARLPRRRPPGSRAAGGDRPASRATGTAEPPLPPPLPTVPEPTPAPPPPAREPLPVTGT